MKKTDTWGGVIAPNVLGKLKKEDITDTYLWEQEYKNLYYAPVYNYNVKNQIFKYKKEDLVTVEIFKNNFTNEDDPDFKEWVWKYESYNKILNKYFYNILALDNDDLVNGLNLAEISKITLPKNKQEEIESIINEYELDQHRDFFLYLIAKAQSVFVNNIYFNESLETYKDYLEVGKDVKGLLKFLENAEKDSGLTSNEGCVSLEGMKFVNERGAYYTIKNNNLIEDIILPNYSYLKNLSLKELKEYFQRYALGKKELIGGQYQRKFKFREVLAKSIHDFLSETHLFKLEGKTILDTEAYCIARLILAADIPFLNKKKKVNDIPLSSKERRGYDISLSSKEREVYDITKPKVISLIKSWCSRTEIERIPFIQVVQPNFDMLKLYFEDSFLKSVNTDQKSSDIAKVILICNENKITALNNEVIHLIKCANNFVKILNVFKSTLLRRKEFNLEQLNINILQELELFLTGYCKSFYKFLLNEIPPKEGDYLSSLRYINVIAQSLIIAGVFPQCKKPNEDIIKNIKIWLELPE